MTITRSRAMGADLMKIDKAITNPAAVFRSPADVLADPDLTREEKIRVLRQWEYDARELEVAEEENMPGGPPDLLAQVLAALDTLDAATDDAEASTKQGG